MALIAAACLSLAIPHTAGASGPGTSLEVEIERDVTISGINDDDGSGFGVATGDINNDGVDDLLIGAEHADPLERNNDGTDDIIIGAGGADPAARTDAGETYVVLGPRQTGPIELSLDASVIFNGIGDFDELGVGVAVGDLNDDGAMDLIMGAWLADPRGVTGAGESYVVFGDVPLAAAPVPALSAWGLIAMALWRSRLPPTRRRRSQTAIMESQRPWSLRSPLPCRPTPPA